MKRIITFSIVLALCLSSLFSCGGGDESISGCFTYGDSSYYFTTDGAVRVSLGAAQFLTYECRGGEITLEGGEIISRSDLVPSSLEQYAHSKEMFTYTNKGAVKCITGLTDAGKMASVLFVPTDVGSIESGALSESNAKALVITDGISALNLSNGSLSCNGKLAVLIDKDVVPGTDLLIGGISLLDGKDNITFYVEKEAYATYKEHYSWGLLSDYIKKLGE